MVEILIQGILNCLMIPDFNEFSMCIDNLVYEVNQMDDVVLEYNMSIEGENMNE